MRDEFSWPPTKRECEIVQLASEGLTGHEIAHRLTLTYSTVRKHEQHALRRAGARSTCELACLLMREHLITGPPPVGQRDLTIRSPQKTWIILITNDATGGETHFEIEAVAEQDAMIEALNRAFLNLGWHHCTAHPTRPHAALTAQLAS